MASKQYFCIIDTETTITDKVVDFAAVICDRKGKIYNQCAILVRDIFSVDPLFYDKSSDSIWSKASVNRRMNNYYSMLDSGSRMLASVPAINRWLDKAIAKYSPTLTAYNLAFDTAKCANTGIDLSGFASRFCLWSASVGNICLSKPYKHFVLQNHLFNNRTAKGNMTYSTTAESVTGFLRGDLTDEPHTALEDIIGYELPTLVHIAKKKNWQAKIKPYNWGDFQVRDHFTVK